MRRMQLISDGGGGGDSEVHQNWGPNRAGANRGGSMRQHGGIGMIQRHADDLGLSDEQHDRLEALKIEFELEKVDKRAALRKAKIRLRAVFQDPDAKEDAVLAAIHAVCDCECELRVMRYRHLQAGRGLLQEQQHQTLRSHIRTRQSEKIRSRRAALA